MYPEKHLCENIWVYVHIYTYVKRESKNGWETERDYIGRKAGRAKHGDSRAPKIMDIITGARHPIPCMCR